MSKKEILQPEMDGTREQPPPNDVDKSELAIAQTHEILTNSLTADDAEKGPALQASKSPAHPIISFWRRNQERARFNEIATQPSVFDDPATGSYYAPPPSYENAHRFDPGFRWTWGEELSILAKLDWRITLWALVMYMVYDMNRTNLAQANTDNFLPDLNMDTDDYNLGNTVFRATALCAEIPMQLLSRKVGM